MIQKTSLEAFEVLKPELNNLQCLIYNVLKIYPDVSNHDLSLKMHKDINCITPRVKELRDKGLVVCSGSKKDEFTHNV